MTKEKLMEILEEIDDDCVIYLDMGLEFGKLEKIFIQKKSITFSDAYGEMSPGERQLYPAD